MIFQNTHEAIIDQETFDNVQRIRGNKKKKRLTIAQKRAGELEKLMCKIYEDNALGKLPDARYAALDAKYAREQDELSIEIALLEKTINGYERSRKSADKFIARRAVDNKNMRNGQRR